MFKFQRSRNFLRENRAVLKKPENVFEVENQSRPLESKFRLTTNENGNQELVLVLPDGKHKLNLNHYLPGNVKLRGGPNNKFSCKELEKSEFLPEKAIPQVEVTFDSEQIDTVRGRLGLLHEIGHGVDYPRPAAEKFSSLQKMIIKEIKRDIVDSVEYMWMEPNMFMDDSEDSKDKQAFFIAQFRKKWREAGKKYAAKAGPKFKYGDLIEALGFLVRSERDAWGNALKLYKKIKTQHNIDLLEGAKGSEIFYSVDRALATYERAYGSIINDFRKKGPLRKLIESYLT
jgi:hypothetical protein